VLENMVLMMIFGHKKEKVTRNWG